MDALEDICATAPGRETSAARRRRPRSATPSSAHGRFSVAARTLTRADHLRAPRGESGRGDRASGRPDPARGCDRHDGVPPVRAAGLDRVGCRGLVRRPQRPAVRPPQPRRPRLPAELRRRYGRSTRGRATASRTTCTSSGSRGRARCCSAPTATRPWPARWACSPIGAGGTEVAVAMAGGRTPRAAADRRCRARGRLQPWVQSKDVVLELLRRRGVRGGRGRIFEFYGEVSRACPPPTGERSATW